MVLDDVAGHVEEVALVLDRDQRALRAVVLGDLERLRFNTMLAALMEFTNFLTKTREAGNVAESIWRETIESLLLLLSPTAPHLTEELWHLLKERSDKECVIVAAWPAQQQIDKSLLADFNWAAEAITQVRNLRSSKGLSPREPLVA